MPHEVRGVVARAVGEPVTIETIVVPDPGPGEAILVGWDHYVAKYTGGGDHVWSYDAGDTAYDGGWGIAVDDSANVYTTGVFFGTIDLDPDTGSYELVSAGGRDIFVAKHAPCASSTTTEDICAESSYTLPNGNAVGAGLYPLSTSVGCDSVLLIAVEAIVLDTNVSQVGNTLIAAETDASYQWLDCNGDPIPAATAQSFEPEVTAKLARVKGVRIYEVGISYYGRTYAEGKKIGWKDGFRAIWCIIKYGL